MRIYFPSKSVILVKKLTGEAAHPSTIRAGLPLVLNHNVMPASCLYIIHVVRNVFKVVLVTDVIRGP